MWPVACCTSMSICRSSTSTTVATSSSSGVGGGSRDKEGSKRTSSPPKGGFGSADTSFSPTVGAGASPGPAAPTVATLGKLPKKGSTDKLETGTDTGSRSSRSAVSAASTIGSDFVNDHLPAHQREVKRIQGQMKAFMKGMIKGREMTVLSVDGQLRACTCSFDRKLRNYSIVISKETRTIPLSKFREVFQGTEPADISTPLDELCATFVLESGECLTFRFEEVAERENFAMCLQIIVDGHQVRR